MAEDYKPLKVPKEAHRKLKTVAVAQDKTMGDAMEEAIDLLVAHYQEAGTERSDPRTARRKK